MWCYRLQEEIHAAVVLGGCNFMHPTGVHFLRYSTYRVLVQHSQVYQVIRGL